MITWVFETLGRNIVIYINTEIKKIKIECNAWTDVSEFNSKLKKKQIIRYWTNKVIERILIPEDLYISHSLQKDLDIHIDDAFIFVNNLTFKDLKNSTKNLF